MRTILAIAAASFVVVGCGSFGSSDSSDGSSIPEDSCVPQVVITKTGVVETCV